MSDRGCVRQLGWIDGHDIAIEYRWTQGRNDRAAVLTEVLRKCEAHGADGRPLPLKDFEGGLCAILI